MAKAPKAKPIGNRGSNASGTTTGTLASRGGVGHWQQLKRLSPNRGGGSTAGKPQLKEVGIPGTGARQSKPQRGTGSNVKAR